MTLKLSVLDQSLARSADAVTDALQETLEMAQWCEHLGYERFWVSEHHAFPSVAGSAPEIILAALGAATKKIRLGSGGIMLPHYSPYKIAEVFSWTFAGPKECFSRPAFYITSTEPVNGDVCGDLFSCGYEP